MRVFDAGPLVSVLLDAPGARKIAAALDSDLTMCRVSSVTYSRVIERVARKSATAGHEVAGVIDWWIAGGLCIDPVDAEMACAAAAIRAEHHHAKRSPITLVDCHAIALAANHHAELASSDAAVLRVAKLVGLKVLALPDATGTLRKP
jgi:predicted nucleic acid-binding protein